MYESLWINELMTYVKEYVNKWVPNLKRLKDPLAKVWRGHKRWSLHVVSLEVLRMTLVRKDVCYYLFSWYGILISIREVLWSLGGGMGRYLDIAQ